MENKQVLYISYDGMTDPLGQSQVLPYLSGLSELGYRFTLVSCEKPDALAKRKDVIEGICRNSGIDWHPLPYTKRPPVLSTLWDIKRIRTRCAQIMSNRSIDLVHCRSYIPALVGMDINKKHGIPWIFDMRGFWANEKVDAGAWSLSHPLYRWAYNFFKQKEKEFLESADAIVILTEAGKREVLTWQHISRKPLPISVIPCCADLDLFDYGRIPPETSADLRNTLRIPVEAFVLGYLGSLGTWYMLDEMVEFYKALSAVMPDCIFLVVTNDLPARMEDLLKKHQVPAENVRLVSTNREEVPLYLSIFNAGLFFIRPTYSKIASSPVKHGEMMGMGIPLICNKGIGDVDSIVELGTGKVIPVFSDEEYAAAAASVQQLEKIPKAYIRDKARQYYSLLSGVEKYADIYRGILSNSTA